MTVEWMRRLTGIGMILCFTGGCYQITGEKDDDESQDSSTRASAGADTEYGPLVYFPFDEDARDVSGNGNHGIANGVTLVAGTQGGEDRAFDFDSDGDYVEFPYVLNPVRQDWTFSIWIKMSSLATDKSDQFLLTRKVTTTDDDVYVYIDNDANELQSWATGARIDSQMSLKRDVWYHLAVTSGDGEVTLYVDGELKEQRSAGYSATFPDGSPFIISSVCTDCEDGWDINPIKGRIWGAVDDVRLYDRALTEDQIGSLYILDSPGE